MHQYISKFNVPKMDCPCEENLIRLKLGNSPLVERLDFDFGGKNLSCHPSRGSEVDSGTA